MAKKLKVALIFGGTSQERKVSLLSAKSVLDNLDHSKYTVEKFEVTVKPDWIGKSLDKIAKCDVALLALHGPGGEDGTLQGLLELLNIKYTCSGVLASALAMDKQLTKKLVASAGIPVLPDIAVTKKDYDKNKTIILREIKDKVVIKPNRLGSSLGISIVSGKAAIDSAIREGLSQSDQIIIEPFIEGREITVPVLGNSHPQVLPVIEIVPWKKSAFYDYSAKYSQGGSDHIIPAPISRQQTKTVQELALIAHETLGCRGITRSDFILDNNGRFWFLEINTIPGMTSTSLAPQSAAAAGINFSQFLDKLIHLALE